MAQKTTDATQIHVNILTLPGDLLRYGVEAFVLRSDFHPRPVAGVHGQNPHAHPHERGHADWPRSHLRNPRRGHELDVRLCVDVAGLQRRGGVRGARGGGGVLSLCMAVVV